MTSESRRRRLSPAMRAFVAVDVVLVIALVVVILATRGGPETSPPPSAAASATADPATPPATSPSAQASQTATSPTRTEDPTEGEDEARLFASPSGNIVCSISPDGASCSIAELSAEGLVEDEDCEGTVGHVVRVTAEGAERPCVTGRPPGKAPSGTPELEYETSTSAFGYTCTSSRSGIICRHDGTGHGFSIARAGSSLF